MNAASKLLWLLCALASCAAAPALAKPPTGSNIDTAPGSVESVNREDAVTAARVANAFARCIAQQQRVSAAALLDFPYASPEQAAAVNRLLDLDQGCFNAAGAQLRLNKTLLVGGMAEGAILDRFKRSPLPPLDSVEPRNGYEEFALCVLRQNASDVRALIETRPRDRHEDEIFARIVPTLSPCLPANQTLTFGRSALRGILAAGLYRAFSAQDAAASKPAAKAAE